MLTTSQNNRRGTDGVRTINPSFVISFQQIQKRNTQDDVAIITALLFTIENPENRCTVNLRALVAAEGVWLLHALVAAESVAGVVAARTGGC
jgi:hypothetical protein